MTPNTDLTLPDHIREHLADDEIEQMLNTILADAALDCFEATCQQTVHWLTEAVAGVHRLRELGLEDDAVKAATSAGVWKMIQRIDAMEIGTA